MNAPHTHTPGPWVANGRGDFVEQGEGAYDDERDYPKLIAKVERRRDAGLIAAAPAMFTALEAAAEGLHNAIEECRALTDCDNVHEALERRVQDVLMGIEQAHAAARGAK